MAIMDKDSESHTDTELNSKYPHLIAIPDVANAFIRESYRFLPERAKRKYWREFMFPADFFHFHRWN